MLRKWVASRPPSSACEGAAQPVSQSETMSRALDTLHRKVSFVRLAGEDHWLSQMATRVQVLEEIEKFLDTQLRKEP